MTNINPADMLLKTDVLTQLEASELTEEVKTDVREWLQSQPGDTVLRQDAIKHMMGVVEIEEFVADTYSDVISELEKTKADLEAVDEQAMIDELQAQRDGVAKMQAETDMAEKIAQAAVASASVAPAASTIVAPSVTETASAPAISAMPTEVSAAMNDTAVMTPAMETPAVDMSAPSSSDVASSVPSGTPEPISETPAPFFTAPQPAAEAAPLTPPPAETTVVASPQIEPAVPAVDQSALQPATHVTTA
jgi:hypothetical protein